MIAASDVGEKLNAADAQKESADLLYRAVKAEHELADAKKEQATREFVVKIARDDNKKLVEAHKEEVIGLTEQIKRLKGRDTPLIG